MKVKELIALLSGLDQEAPVLFKGDHISTYVNEFDGPRYKHYAMNYSKPSDEDYPHNLEDTPTP